MKRTMIVEVINDVLEVADKISDVEEASKLRDIMIDLESIRTNIDYAMDNIIATLASLGIVILELSEEEVRKMMEETEGDELKMELIEAMAQKMSGSGRVH